MHTIAPDRPPRGLRRAIRPQLLAPQTGRHPVTHTGSAPPYEISPCADAGQKNKSP